MKRKIIPKRDYFIICCISKNGDLSLMIGCILQKILSYVFGSIRSSFWYSPLYFFFASSIWPHITQRCLRISSSRLELFLITEILLSFASDSALLISGRSISVHIYTSSNHSISAIALLTSSNGDHHRPSLMVSFLFLHRATV